MATVVVFVCVCGPGVVARWWVCRRGRGCGVTWAASPTSSPRVVGAVLGVLRGVGLRRVGMRLVRSKMRKKQACFTGRRVLTPEGICDSNCPRLRFRRSKIAEEHVRTCCSTALHPKLVNRQFHAIDLRDVEGGLGRFMLGIGAEVLLHGASSCHFGLWLPLRRHGFER